jgi:hypothetical protein
MRNARQAKDVWAERVAEVEAGASPGDVAARHGVNERTLRWWRSRLRNGAAAAPRAAHAAGGRLVPLVFDSRGHAEIEVVVGDCRATFPMETPIAYVKQLVAVLRAC